MPARATEAGSSPLPSGAQAARRTSSSACSGSNDTIVGPDIVEHLRRIDATLEPFGGRFVLHGEPVEVLEGSWSGDLVVIEFPDRKSARAWYASPAYQRILPLRTENSRCVVFLTDGVPADHKATDVLAGVPAMAQPLG